MLQAMMVIMRSMEPGKGKDSRAKYATSQKIRGAFLVLWGISPEAGANVSLLSSSKGGCYMATCNQ